MTFYTFSRIHNVWFTTVLYKKPCYQVLNFRKTNVDDGVFSSGGIVGVINVGSAGIDEEIDVVGKGTGHGELIVDLLSDGDLIGSINSCGITAVNE